MENLVFVNKIISMEQEFVDLALKVLVQTLKEQLASANRKDKYSILLKVLVLLYLIHPI